MLLRSTTLRLLSLALLLLTTEACKKTTDAVSTRKCLVRSYDVSGAGITHDYNVGGQLIKLTGALSVSQVQEYTYSPGQITMRVNPAPVKDGTLSATYLLNSAGYITKIARVLRPYGSTTLTTYSQFFEYNTDGYLTKITFDDGTYRTLEYANGNNTVTKEYTSSGVLRTTYTNTFYEDKTPPISPITDFLGINIESPSFYAAGLFGQSVKNPLKQSISAGTYNNGVTISYTYAYDADGNIASALQTYLLKGNATPTVSTINYTYLCQ
ncbi:DUF4595 domain-containing protein [uncultured Fibrella sp.]|uniref:DUF4595 domain-containing protein n=1 Tax=uncultured Fibrella sp. TaxID=1284596 RepID=UPI0035CC414C